jgi:lipopolysaccharide/colanic/teichoic acid biosynthesis glycosyltransferase
VLTRDEKISRLFLICFTAVAFVLLYYTNRYGRRWLQKYSPFESLRAKLSTLIIGSEEWRGSILQKIEKNSDLFDVLPHLPDHSINSEAELVAAVEQVNPDLLIFPARELSYDTSIALFALGDRKGFRCWVPVEISRRHGRQFELQDLGGIDVLTPPTWPLAEPLNRAIKRFMDIILGTAGVIFLTAPVSAIVFLLQRMRSPGPLFCKCPVVGQDGALFEMLSFRTIGSKISQTEADPYPGARHLREQGFDTIPRFINVLRGEMSIVGPPPFSPEQKTRLEGSVDSSGLRQFIKPGMTGLSQVDVRRVMRDNLRDARRSARYDRFYAKHWSLNLDFRCVLTTIIKQFRGIKSAHTG